MYVSFSVVLNKENSGILYMSYLRRCITCYTNCFFFFPLELSIIMIIRGYDPKKKFMQMKKEMWVAVSIRLCCAIKYQ